MIHSKYPYIPIYALVDFDPDGIGIMRTYKFGSRSLQHEENVTVPRLSWLGVKSSDIFYQDLPRYALSQSSSEVSVETHFSESSVSLSQSTSSPRLPHLHWNTSSLSILADVDYKTIVLLSSDRIKAINILATLETPYSLDAEEVDLARELQLMLMLNVKFEIQAIDDGSNMTRWLDLRLSSILHHG